MLFFCQVYACTSLGRPRRGWVDNIRTDLQEVGLGMLTGLGWPRIGAGGGRL